MPKPVPSQKPRTKRPEKPARERTGVPLFTVLARAGSVAVVLGIAGAWVFGKDALQRASAQIDRGPMRVVMNWPRLPEDPRARAQGRTTPTTWMPASIQRELLAVVSKNISADPFDQVSLERTRTALIATGWFEVIDRVIRRPEGLVEVEGRWRAPAAVVRSNGREHLVARGGELLLIPESNPVEPGTMFTIFDPPERAPATADGAPAYGQAWAGEEVRAAIALIEVLRNEPGARQIVGIDLSEYRQADAGRLVIVTDKGTRIVWGAALDRNAPGEVSVERKLARLQENLSAFRRIDANRERLEIYTPLVWINKTAADNG